MDQAVATDSDSDEMDVDVDDPKPKKGILDSLQKFVEIGYLLSSEVCAGIVYSYCTCFFPLV